MQLLFVIISRISTAICFHIKLFLQFFARTNLKKCWKKYIRVENFPADIIWKSRVDRLNQKPSYNRVTISRVHKVGDSANPLCCPSTWKTFKGHFPRGQAFHISRTLPFDRRSECRQDRSDTRGYTPCKLPETFRVQKEKALFLAVHFIHCVLCYLIVC